MAQSKPEVLPERIAATREAAIERKTVLEQSASFVVTEPRKDVMRPNLEWSATFLLGETRKELQRPNVTAVDLSVSKKFGHAPVWYPTFSSGVLKEPQKQTVMTGHDLPARAGWKFAQRFSQIVIARAAAADMP